MGSRESTQSVPKKGCLDWLIRITLVGVFAFCLLISLPPTVWAPNNSAKLSQQLKVIGSLLLVCWQYESDHGHFPKRLEDIVTENYMDAPELLETTLTENGEPKPLVYRPGASRASDPPVPVIWTPEPFGRKIVVGYSNGRIVAEREDQIEEILGDSDGSKAD